MASLAAAIDVDAEDATKPSSPRIIGGSGDAAAPLELASSSDDEATPAQAPTPAGSSGAAPPRKRDRDDSSSHEQPPAKKINPFKRMMGQERPVNSYLEDPASFKSGGVVGLPRRVLAAANHAQTSASI